MRVPYTYRNSAGVLGREGEVCVVKACVQRRVGRLMQIENGSIDPLEVDRAAAGVVQMKVALSKGNGSRTSRAWVTCMRRVHGSRAWVTRRGHARAWGVCMGHVESWHGACA